jgi:peptide/nickel transport system ATP-binding protein
MLLDVRDLSVTYRQSGGESRDAVNAIGFSIAKGESLALVGESGSGKSTIAKSILGLVPHREGHIRFADQELDSLSKREKRRLRRRMGVIFQSPSRSLNPRTSIGDSIAEPLRANDGLTRVARGRVVRELIDRVQLPASVFNAYPSELSGGQLQRASIARALALEPSLLIADEPTSALDVSVQAEILELLAEIQHDSRFACLFISHDLPLVASFCNGILVLNKGKAVEQGEMKQVLSHPSQDYTRQLLLSAPLPNPDIQLRRRQSRLSA